MLRNAFKNLVYLCLPALASMLIVVLWSPHANAQNDDDSCLSNIEETFDGISSASGIEFCEDFREGWTFGINPHAGYNGLATDGTILRLFDFRQPNWRRGQPNTLGFELVLHNPDIPNLFEIHIRDGENLHNQSGIKTFFLWGRDVRTPLGNHGPYGSKWNPVRLIRCFKLGETGQRCITNYNVILCRNYRYPNRPNRPDGRTIEPIITVSTQTPEASEDLLENFNLAHNLIEESLERLLEHSCRQAPLNSKRKKMIWETR